MERQYNSFGVWSLGAGAFFFGFGSASLTYTTVLDSISFSLLEFLEVFVCTAFSFLLRPTFLGSSPRWICDLSIYSDADSLPSWRFSSLLLYRPGFFRNSISLRRSLLFHCSCTSGTNLCELSFPSAYLSLLFCFTLGLNLDVG